MDERHSFKEAMKGSEQENPSKEFLKALGPAALTLSDDEIKRVHYMFKRFADVVFDKWLEKRNAGLLDMEETI